MPIQETDITGAQHPLLGVILWNPFRVGTGGTTGPLPKGVAHILLAVAALQPEGWVPEQPEEVLMTFKMALSESEPVAAVQEMGVLREVGAEETLILVMANAAGSLSIGTAWQVLETILWHKMTTLYPGHRN